MTSAGETQSAIRVELVDASQAELVLRLAVEAFAEFRDTLVPPPGILVESVDDVARYIETGGAVIAWDCDVPVGSARFHPEPDHLYIGRVAVPPAYRRRGIATEMMRFLEDHARSIGFTETRVQVRQSLPSNVALYQSLGYIVRSADPHPRVPEAIVLTLIKRL
ncbi:MAG TPA: GNAT family N-acetyltransferase [Thermomicrobiales bacterium]|nr:GNAT family N-acetyltransferase [Thermomicrobiales bacterium]